MTALLTVLGSGISARKILEFLMRKSPAMAQKISSALASGISAEKVAKFFTKEKNFEKLRSEMEQDYSLQNNANPLVQAENIRSKNLGQDMASSLQRATPGIIGGAAALGTGLALQHALPNLLKGSMSGIEEKIQETPQQIPPSVKSSQVPQIPSKNIPQVPETVQDAETILNKLGLNQHIDKIAKNRRDPREIAAILYNQFPKEMLALQKESGKPMEEVIGDYLSKKTSEQTQVSPSLEFPSKQLDEAKQEAQGITEPKVEMPITEQKELPPIEKNSTVGTPQGIGEVKAIRNGKAIVEIDGKKHQVNEDELEREPPDLEETVRELVNKIPEKMKSTAIQTSTYVPLPEGKSVTLIKFYDGKIAWYLDVPENTYDAISLGTYEPKGKAITGIGEYKPGVIDSRGAGFHNEIRMNPKYSKENKGITWGYAKNDYDALKDIQPILHKISKEKYDEQGNLI